MHSDETIKPWHRLGWIVTGLTLIILQYHVAIIWLYKYDTFIYSKITSSIFISEFPVNIILDLLYYIAIIVVSHIVIALLSLQVSSVLQKRYSLTKQNADAIGLFVFMCFWAFLLLYNSIEYRRSIFAYPHFDVLGIINQTNLLILSTLVSISACIFLLANLLISLRTRLKEVAVSVVVLGLALVLMANYPANSSNKNTRYKSGEDKPNVIIIGIDSLMLEYLREERHADVLPFVRSYLEDAVVFSEVYTPQARTFPSWMTILSGKYPLHNNARINLVNTDNMDTSNLLQNVLKKSGYSTMYAIDEVRFSNMDESFGFDSTLTPKIGAADFIIGEIGDMPLVNVLRNTSLAKTLFPYHYINRAMKVSYKPGPYSNELSDNLDNITQRPAFIATHFCLPHWPYFSHEKINHGILYNVNNHSEYYMPVYEDALKKVDEQTRLLFEDLEEKGFLENAIVILLSDHGETIGRKNDFPYYLPEDDSSSLNRHRYGHGTNLFADKQYEILLSFKRFGGEQYLPGTREQISSTIDIYPTILELLDVESNTSLDGISLVPWIMDQQDVDRHRAIFMETGFYLPALNKINPSTRELMEQGIGYYKINSEGRLVVNESMIDSIIFGKQLGVRNSDSVLGTFSVSNEQINLYFADRTNVRLVQITEQNFRDECIDDCRELLDHYLNFYKGEGKYKLELALGNELTDELVQSSELN